MISGRSKRYCVVVFLCCLLNIGLFRADAVGQEKKHILVVHSYNKGLEWTDNEDEGIMTALRPQLDTLDVYTEYMDTKRVTGGAYIREFHKLLQQKYAKTVFQCIITTDDDAFNFILRDCRDLFPGVPVVFCGVNYLDDSVVAANRNLVTGVVEAFDVPATLRMALKLVPDTSTIAVINDRTTTGIANQKILDRVLPAFASRVKFEFLTDLSMADLQRKVQSLKQGTLILLMTFNRDSTGHDYDYDQSISLISRAAKVPMFGVWEFYLGKGIVGGMLTSGRIQGENAATMALRLLHGDHAKDIAVMKTSLNRFMFDYRQLKRFNIDLSSLPGGSVIRYRPQTFQQSHPQLFDAGIAAVSCLLLVILLLLVRMRDKKRSLQELEGAHRRTVTILESIADGFVAYDRAFRFTYVNNEAERILGRSRNDLLGRSHWEALPVAGGDPIEAFYRQVMETREAGELEYRLGGKDAEKNQWIALKAYPAEGGGLSVYFKDITVQMQLEKNLRQAQKMEAIGTLAGGIAHDFNNILSIIIGFTEMAKMKLPESSPVEDHLQRVLDAGARATDLVKQILTFSRWTEQEKKPIQVASFIKETLKLLQPLLPATIEIHKEISVTPERSVVLMDPTEIHQVVMNLCTNAAHAMRDKGGRLSIRVSELVADAFFLSRNPDLEAGSYVCLSISDTGVGMDTATVERIFDPYFTTKDPGVGTGLGLPVVQGIVKGHHGAVTVYSEPGKGTTFNVFLPRIEGGGSAPVLLRKDLPRGSERVLFVDDERHLAELGAQMLAPFGYKVTAMTSSREALAMVRSDASAFDLVVTDMTMPAPTGMELAMEIKAVRPDIPIILCTGFSDLINEAKARESGIDAFLLKPYAAADLVLTMHGVLRK